MASFARGQRGSRAGSLVASRAARAGRGSGRARGKDSFTTNNRHRSTFHSTRIEEQVEKNAELSHENKASIQDDHDSRSASHFSSDEDSEDEQPTANSYNKLLQSLHGNVQRGPPQRKKRRIEIENRREPQFLEDPENDPEEQDGVEATDVGCDEDQSDPDDIAALDEIEDGMYICLFQTMQFDHGSCYGRSIRNACC